MKYIIVIVILFLSKISFSQIIFNKIENEESKSTILKLKDHLLSANLPYYNVHTTRPDTTIELKKAYDRIIYQFYDTAKMNKRFAQIEKDSGASYEMIKGYQYAVLASMANMLRCVPHDSIYIMGNTEYNRINNIEESDTKINKNTVFIGFVTKSNWNDFYFIEFDEAGKNIILMAPIIHFERQNNNNEAEEFLDRHCKDFIRKTI